MSMIKTLYVLSFILPLTHFSIFWFFAFIFGNFLSFIIQHFSSRVLKENMTHKQQSVKITSVHLAQWLIRNWKHLHSSNPGKE